MAQDRLSALSTEYVAVPVTAEKDGGPVDLTTTTVSLAFVHGRSDPSQWFPGSWEATSESDVSGTYNALCLVGPNGGETILAEGLEYFVWVKIDAPPETPVHRAGTLKVY